MVLVAHDPLDQTVLGFHFHPAAHEAQTAVGGNGRGPVPLLMHCPLYSCMRPPLGSWWRGERPVSRPPVGSTRAPTKTGAWREYTVAPPHSQWDSEFSGPRT